MSRERQVFNTQNGVTGGVWRDGDVIIKQLRSEAQVERAMWTPSNDPRHWLYWRREAFAYETGLPERMGLRGPNLRSATETPTGVELQLDALAGRTADDVTVPDLTRLAMELGRAQGRDDLPADEWLSRGFLRAYATSERADYALLDDDAAWAHPLVEPFVTDELRADLVWMHANVERLLAIAEALPRTVCHLDLFPNNVFATDDGVALIDWSFSGDGAIGEDISNLIPDSIFDLNQPLDALPDLEAMLPTAYRAGLREAGWRGDDRLVELGIHACAVKYDWLAPRILVAATDGESTAYADATVDQRDLFTSRWQGLALVTRWARAAVAEADRLRIG